MARSQKAQDAPNNFDQDGAPPPRSPAGVGAGKSGADSKRRYQVTLTGEALANAEALAAEHDVSLGEACRRGLAVLKFLSDEEDKGSAFQLETSRGDRERIRILYA